MSHQTKDPLLLNNNELINAMIKRLFVSNHLRSKRFYDRLLLLLLSAEGIKAQRFLFEVFFSQTVGAVVAK